MLSTYQPLYLKYRPQTIKDLVGQKAVTSTLINAIEHGRLAHAFLFTGPRGTGKTSTARILAKSLNCKSGPTQAPCLECTSCKEIKEGISPAVIEIDAASNNSVDDARLLIERAPLVAPTGRFKLYIIDECHMLTKEAFNALLKTIEEPPDKVIFILATTEEHKVPPTIISRCQRLMFRLVSHPELVEHLKTVANAENLSISEAAISMIARRSQGGLRDALGLLDQAGLLAHGDQAVEVSDLLNLLGAVEEDVLISLSESILNGDAGKALSLVSKMLEQGREPSLIALELAKHFLNIAKVAFVKASSASSDRSLDAQSYLLGSAEYVSKLSDLAALCERQELAQIVERLDKLELTIRRTSQPVLNLETGLIALCHRHDIERLSELDARLQKLETILASEGLLKEVKGRSPEYQPDHKTEQKAELKPQTANPESKQETKEDLEDDGYETVELEDAPDSEESPKIEVPEPKVAAAAAVLSKEKEPVSQPVSQPVESVDLDQLWSGLLELLQERHLPTYSLLCTHAIPVEATSSDLIVGVVKDHFQKMLESKSEHIRQALKDSTGNPMNVRIKVVAQPAQPAAAVKSKAEPAYAKAQAENGDDAEEPEPVAKAVEPVKKAGQTSPMPKTSGTNLIQEAYRLFEGPGSRLVN